VDSAQAQAELSAVQEGIVHLIERCAAVQSDPAGSSGEAARLQGEIVELMGSVGPLQGAEAVVSAPRIPVSRAAMAAGAAGGSDIVCTLDGGVEAMRARITQWQDVLAAVAGREPAEGGITLVYEHDEARTVELARLAAAEFACCSFFTFTLAVGPAGVRFTVTAPDEAHDVITAVFGTATPTSTSAGGN
jgi:hypothetical protein